MGRLIVDINSISVTNMNYIYLISIDILLYLYYLQPNSNLIDHFRLQIVFIQIPVLLFDFLSTLLFYELLHHVFLYRLKIYRHL